MDANAAVSYCERAHATAPHALSQKEVRPDKAASTRSICVAVAVGWILLCLCASTSRADETASIHPFPKPLRYEEDYRYLADSSKRDDIWDPVKYIPLTSLREAYLTVGGEWRERYEYYGNPAFGLGGTDHDNFLLHRLLLSADLHVSKQFRTFVQLGSHFVSGREGPVVPTDKDVLDLQQGFLEATAKGSDTTQIGLRAGRQEIIFGSGRLVTVREGPNIRRSFDGARAMLRNPKFSLDALLVRTVRLEDGIFDDKSNPDETLWGLYGVAPVPVVSGAHLDFYYLGLDRDPSAYAAGVADERRHSVGGRLWGAVESFDYNLEALYQFGEFGSGTIRAWGASSDVGITLSNLWWRPRIGLKADAESGDGDLSDNRLETFNPLFPNHAYFSEAALAAPMNGLDVHPNLTLQLADGLNLRIGWDFFWREDTSDSIYTASLVPIPGTAGGDSSYIGNLITVHAQWRPDRHIELNADYTHFNAGDTVSKAGGTDVDFVMLSAAYRF